ncbi:uncharacterized protein PRCAT00005469001 [Priceomyces carsonii]|uniref:uncharacterized protein n=1 Tax=Priceomyces carsonii TaxID=28549 RepID=UPI002EDB2691|nr:unnamed protein product [Priceomyces carsonii]
MNLEPSTTAKVEIETTKGSIEIELWAKEIPNTCKIFIQNCLNKKYVGEVFGKVEKDFLIQTTSTEKPDYGLEDEFHSRIRFNRRFLIVAVKQDKDRRNGNSVDSFFITLREAKELNNKYIVFGKVVGNSHYTAVKINNGELNGDKPVYPARITDINVHEKFFEDISEPTIIEEPIRKKRKKKTSTVKLSYDFEEDDSIGNFKMRSAHDVLNDKKLSNKLFVKSEVKETQASTIGEIKEQELMGYHDRSEGPEDIEASSTQPLRNKQLLAKQDSKEMRGNCRDELSDYDPNLDLSSEESFDLEAFHKHKFTGK